MIAHLAKLSEDLARIQKLWKEAKRPQQDKMYAVDFGPRFAPLFADLPLHGAPNELGRPVALISVLGFSWQPVALMAAWARPERMLVLGTKESLGISVGEEPVLKLISRISCIPLERVEHREIPSDGEIEIYQEVRAFINRHGFEPKSVFIDPTGGKKTMSTAAGLAGFLLGAPLVYVDYGEYHGENRIPVAGTEYPRLVANPLEVLGDIEIDMIRAAFNSGSYPEAEHRASELASRLYEPREAQALELLARGYRLWDAFHFKAALLDLEKLPQILERHVRRGKWAWADEVRKHLDPNIRVLRALQDVSPKPASIEDGLPLVLNHLAAANRALGFKKTSQAVMLGYATVERYVDLCLWTLYRLDDEKPDYELLRDHLDRNRYDEAGLQLFGKKNYQPRELEGKLQFGNGIQLLAALAPERIELEDLGPLKGLAAARNKCEFEHGFLPQPLDGEKALQPLQQVKRILARAFGSVEALEVELATYSFPKL